MKISKLFQLFLIVEILLGMPNLCEAFFRWPNPSGNDRFWDKSKLPVKFYVNLSIDGYPTTSQVLVARAAADAWWSYDRFSYKFSGQTEDTSFLTAEEYNSIVSLDNGAPLGNSFGCVLRSDGSSVNGFANSLTKVSGEIIDGGIVICEKVISISSGQQKLKPWYVGGFSDKPDKTQLDVFSTITHELGHILGLAHTSEKPDEKNPKYRYATMYYSGGAGENHRRDINIDDDEGLKAIYPTIEGMMSCPSVSLLCLEDSSTGIKECFPSEYCTMKTGAELDALVKENTWDKDNDGLADSQELQFGTDPSTPDGDGDGLLDGAEFNYQCNPQSVDTDGDGLTDFEEAANSLKCYDPTDAQEDYDGDGLTNAQEIKFGTLIGNADSDGDGIDDPDEITLGLNPMNPDDAVEDPDGDDLINRLEVTIGTNPFNYDTDADGLSDGAEVNTYSTNPKLTDTDGDWLKDGEEVNQYKTNPKFSDTDGDSLTDGDEVIYKGTNPLLPDTDTDGAGDETDNCSLAANPDQLNTDGDTQGDTCDADDDNDEVLDINDNCQVTPNTGQGNVDQDLWGDVCDNDKDNDGLSNEEEVELGTDPAKKDTDNDSKWDKQDNCPLIANIDQKNTDSDAQGDICDNDDDSDGVVDTGDNCPLIVNTDQKNTDGDSEGDVCDSDDDNDTVLDTTDNCPLIANTDQANNDQDPLGDLCDPDDDNDDLTDDEEKVLGADPFKPDTDSDSVGDKTDNCPLFTNTNQKNTDGDSKGDVCDPDDDNDNVADGSDNCSLVINTNQANNEQDSEGDACDLDDDNDNLSDTEEVPLKTDPFNPDTDGDGLIDGEEVKKIGTNPLSPDTDGDGLTDKEEVITYGTKPTVADTDADGLTDGEEVKKYGTKPLDNDTDKDALLDGDEVKMTKTNPLLTDTDGDFIPDGAEVKEYQTDPLKVDTDGDGLDDGLEVYLHKTDPLVVDTDQDELTDFEEVTKYKTNPLDPNTDADCWPDGYEVQFASYGYQPTIKQGPTISLKPKSLDFGKVNRRGKMLSYELANTGNFNLVVQGKIKGAGFEMGPVPTQLAPGKKVKVPVVFHPVQAGPVSGETTFQSNDCIQKVVKIPLKVEGLFANLKVDTQEIDFGFVDRFTTEQKSVTISNPFSNTTLKVAVTSQEVAFWPEKYLVEVPPMGTKELVVNFRPYRYGEVKGELTLKAFLASNTQEAKIPLLGFGSGPPPSLSPSDYTLKFNNAGWKHLTITNKGESDLYVSEIRVLDETGKEVPFTEGGTNDFVFVSAYGNLYVPAGKKRDLPIRYQPKDNKKHQGTLVLIYNGMAAEGSTQMKIQLIEE